MCWERFEKFYPGDPPAQLRAWLREMAAHVADSGERGCPLVNAAVEPPEKSQPARRVIRGIQDRTMARLREPELLAGELNLLLEGARVTAQSVGIDSSGARLLRVGEAVIARHAPP